jgi:glucuronoarabinoxylan endo-1,4-beta-xylanase
MKKYFQAGAVLGCGLLAAGCTSVLRQTNKQETSIEVKNYVPYIFTPSVSYQTIDGFGAAYTWYADWIQHDEQSAEKGYDALFSDAKLSVLRFKNEYEYEKAKTASNGAAVSGYYAASVKRCAAYGEKPVILMCCWSPPAALKSNNDIPGKDGATLKKNADGKYCYDEYGQWWTDAVRYYRSLGIQIDFVSIQNEVEFTASYDGCRFDPEESKSCASYAEAFLSVYRHFRQAFGSTAPKMLAPETMSCVWGTISPYLKQILAEEPDSIYGIAHHLYVGGTSDSDKNEVDPDSYLVNFMTMNQFYGTTHKWQTEFYIGHALQTAKLINNSLVYENANAYLYWSGVWHTDGSAFETGELLNAEWSGRWYLCADYYVMRHFSEFIRPGYVRIKSVTSDTQVASSAYISPDKSKVAAVLINLSEKAKGYTVSSNEEYTMSSVTAYQSVFGDTALSADTCYKTVGLTDGNKIILPPGSMTTVVITGAERKGQ